MQLEFWGGIKTLPWIIKPVYGILSDAVPLLGYHRRSYLILFGLLGELQRSAEHLKEALKALQGTAEHFLYTSSDSQPLSI